MTPGIALDGVSRQFRTGAGVRDLSLQVAGGRIVALVGLNGAGKTTLLRLTTGMLRPDAGTVRLGGGLLERMAAADWRRVGHLVDTPFAYPELTVVENLSCAAALHGARRDAVDRSLDEWRLTEFAGRRIRHLSLGNRQRVGLAAALQHDPDVIVLDEPANALDPAGVIVLREALQRRARDGAAVLVSSHHLDEVARIADTVELMNRGRLIGALAPTGADLERAFFDRVHLDDRERGAA